MKISFHGADRGVTGSCHLIQCGGHPILIDCGLYHRQIIDGASEVSIF